LRAKGREHGHKTGRGPFSMGALAGHIHTRENRPRNFA
jgi:hypothetical protein